MSIGFLGNINLFSRTPLLHICAGERSLTITDPNLSVYVGTNPPASSRDMATVTFQHPFPVGATLIYGKGPGWTVVPVESATSVKLVNGEGKECPSWIHLDSGPLVSITFLTEGFNRLFLDDQEISLLVPGARRLREGDVVHFTSSHDRAEAKRARPKTMEPIDVKSLNPPLRGRLGDFPDFPSYTSSRESFFRRLFRLWRK